MKVEDLKNPQRLVLQVETQSWPCNPGKTFTGVVAGENFIMLNGTGVTGESLPVRCVTILGAEVTGVWASLKQFYLSHANAIGEARVDIASPPHDQTL